MKPLHKEYILLDYSLFFPVIPDFSVNYRFAINLIFLTETTLFLNGMISKFTSDLENSNEHPWEYPHRIHSSFPRGNTINALFLSFSQTQKIQTLKNTQWKRYTKSFFNFRIKEKGLEKTFHGKNTLINQLNVSNIFITHKIFPS